MTARETLLRISDLPTVRPTHFRVEPTPEALEALRKELDLFGLKKLRFEGRITPEGQDDWRLDAQLGATVVQSCVVTLEPVTTRIDEPVSRLYLAHPPELPDGAEVEMPEDETQEPLPAVLDLTEVMSEALALALPVYPRAPDAELEQTQFTEPGKTPMTDDATKPFAGLASLRDKLGKSDT